MTRPRPAPRRLQSSSPCSRTTEVTAAVPATASASQASLIATGGVVPGHHGGEAQAGAGHGQERGHDARRELEDRPLGRLVDHRQVGGERRAEHGRHSDRRDVEPDQRGHRGRDHRGGGGECGDAGGSDVLQRDHRRTVSRPSVRVLLLVRPTSRFSRLSADVHERPQAGGDDRRRADRPGDAPAPPRAPARPVRPGRGRRSQPDGARAGGRPVRHPGAGRVRRRGDRPAGA